MQRSIKPEDTVKDLPSKLTNHHIERISNYHHDVSLQSTANTLSKAESEQKSSSKINTSNKNLPQPSTFQNDIKVINNLFTNEAIKTAGFNTLSSNKTDETVNMYSSVTEPEQATISSARVISNKPIMDIRSKLKDFLDTSFKFPEGATAQQLAQLPNPQNTPNSSASQNKKETIKKPIFRKITTPTCK
eukprot:CAMPEP_0114601978 /NCGR_PEP_ID=MMETSP0125-20121206/24594_1 /TAXON_ID=485358 ORGANISM="Aristerostoma sp., Strain ATCC 50986" /NCGR_SAMPLE_ID=MMETSP0125 /ASSEMBLY_ACC=CAM_ASM_000245 /LENGTH=188 /DNA_ID=CAMNT_0001811741 /DNA_START=712 /DNA_END=1278 /DNA_ORIENTATION=+